MVNGELMVDFLDNNKICLIQSVSKPWISQWKMNNILTKEPYPIMNIKKYIPGAPQKSLGL